MAVLGKTPADRLKTINQGGLTIRTTLKPAMQKAAMKEITKAVPVGNKQNLGAAATILEPGTGKILAMAQATDFDKVQTNINVDQKYGGGELGYQFGSTAKMFGLVTALEKGMPLNGTIKVPFADGKKGHLFADKALLTSKCGANEPWSVKNDYASGGKMMTLGEGIAKSINTWAAQLVINVGPCDVRDTMTKMGLHKGNGKPIDPYVSDITLGSGTTNPMSLANAYATLAASGKYCEPYPITSITTSDKKSIKVPGPQCKQVISADAADGATSLLKGTLEFGTAKGNWDVNARPAAGKTGTTEKHNQSWFVGYTKQLASAVWIGNLKPASKNGKLNSLNGKCFGEYGCISQVFGGTVSAPVWSKMMRAVSKGMPVKDFPAPSAKIRNGDLEPLPGRHRRQHLEGAVAPEGRRLRQLRRGQRRQLAAVRHGRLHRPGRRGLPRVEDRAVHLHRRAGRTSSRPRRTTPTPTRARARATATAAPNKGHVPPRRVDRPGRRSAPGQHLLDDGGHPAAVGASGHLRLGGLHDQAHLRHPGRTGRLHGPRHDRLQLVVAELGRQVGLEHHELGLLDRGSSGRPASVYAADDSLRFLASLATTLSTSSSLSSRASSPATSALVMEVSVIRKVPERTLSRARIASCRSCWICALSVESVMRPFSHPASSGFPGRAGRPEAAVGPGAGRRATASGPARDSVGGHRLCEDGRMSDLARTALRTVGGLVGAGVAGVAYAALVERTWFTLRRFAVPALPAGQRPRAHPAGERPAPHPGAAQEDRVGALAGRARARLRRELR